MARRRVAVGAGVFGVGAFVVVRTVLDFFMVGGGTLAPWDPPRRLLTVGLFGVCRNPMYIGVITTVAGWATTFRSPTVAAYACVLAAVLHLRVIRFEEPWAEQSFPDTWPTYRERVPRWFPRLRRR
ncbi:MAG: isoprenylcysteine carboxylmethyltransferase family protein [Acidimicrobiia bacterium]|nr:isoprenylcysteine carboxylmethyltransferase family protein [Acidimicrobiia bacterium]